MKASRRIWYISLIAVYYFVICSLTSIYYLSQHFVSDPMTIPWSTQLLCFGDAICAALYFTKPRLGHRALIIFTLLTLFAVGESDTHATGFHLAVLAILLLPFLLNRRQISAANRTSDLPRPLA